MTLFINIDIYETINTNSSNEIGRRNNIPVNDSSASEASNLEMQVCRAYEVEKRTVLMEHNAAYGTQQSQANDIKMQSCDAYEVEKKSVIMEHNAAYGSQQSQTNGIEL